MKVSERDDLLVRLDERTSNILLLTAEQEKHLRKINNHLDDHSKRITIMETRVEEHNNQKTSKKAIAGYSGGGVMLLALTVLQVLQTLGYL